MKRRTTVTLLDTLRTCSAAASVGAILLGAPTAFAQPAGVCPVPSAAELAERYRDAARLEPKRLAALAPELDAAFEWRKNSLLVTYSTGAARSVDLRTGAVRDFASGAAPAEPDTSDVRASRAYAPDGVRFIEFVANDLQIGSADAVRLRLTTGGSQDFAYGVTPDAGTTPVTRAIANERTAPFGEWSPDGRYFATLQVDQRNLRPWPLVTADSSNAGHAIPRVWASKIAIPGDANVPVGHVVILDTVGRSIARVQVPPLLLAYQAYPIGGMRWASDSRRLFVGHESRDYKRLDVYVANAVDGRAKLLLTEADGERALRPYADATVFTPIGAREVLIYSERDGRGHLYLHDANSGALIRRLTAGDWSVVPAGDGALHVDERRRRAYFIGVGRERDRDPYHRHLYSVSLDGGDPRLLTPEDADHNITLAPNSSAFVDRYSTVATPTTTVVRRADGSLIARVGRIDFEPLRRAGFAPPQRFSVFAADGRTRLWGTLWLPKNFTSLACVPVLDAIYAGPQIHWAPAEFLRDWNNAASVSALGFAVMELDARGTPLRDAAFRNATWGREFGAAVVANDHAAAVEQLRQRMPQLAKGGAGMFGHSWGGYYTLRALAQRPDVFTVGVASAGSHDNLLYAYEHNRWFGSPQEFPDTYVLQSNLRIAADVRGRLMLAHGDADDDVHPINTILMAGALAEAGKPFDMLILPGLNHSTLTENPYFVRRRWDYFVQHLLGVEPPPGLD
jgi:dipeptidyl-peptidase 4